MNMADSKNAMEAIDYKEETLLLVDDEPILRETVSELLSAIGFQVESAPGGAEALSLLGKKTFNLLITDMKMPEMDGMDLIKVVRREFPGVDIIAMTGYTGGYRYVDVVNAGANDFIKKPFDIEELEAKIRRLIYERRMKDELSRLSVTDSLTGLFNHRHFYGRLKEEMTRASRQKYALALIFLDLDDFKAYNDTYGHLAGDDLLRDAAQILLKSIREGVDSGYRYGGDEFAAILIDADRHVTEVIRKRIRSSMHEHEKLSASIGSAIFSEGMSVKDLVAEADRNLYEEKMKRKKQA